jgi:hypothetical protein
MLYQGSPKYLKTSLVLFLTICANDDGLKQHDLARQIENFESYTLCDKLKIKTGTIQSEQLNNRQNIFSIFIKYRQRQ